MVNIVLVNFNKWGIMAIKTWYTNVFLIKYQKGSYIEEIKVMADTFEDAVELFRKGFDNDIKSCEKYCGPIVCKIEKV